MVFLGDILSALQEQGFGLLLRGDQIGPQTGEKRSASVMALNSSRYSFVRLCI